MNQMINLEHLHVQVVSEASGIFCGKNLQVSWRSIQKTNQGYGTVSGDSNIVPTSLNSVNDTDLLDSYVPIQKLETTNMSNIPPGEVKTQQD